jgi:phage repressor protein C with HTH and peptisase S24 domain
MGVGKRLKEVRTIKKLTQDQIAKELGFEWYKIKDIEREKLKLTIDIALLIEQKYHIDPWWLLTGRGEMKPQTSPTIKNNQLLANKLSCKAGVGGGIYNFEISVSNQVVLDLVFFKTKPNPKDINIIDIDGDSMYPTLKSGDQIVIDKSKANSTLDDIYVIIINGQLMVKRLQFNIDKSINIISDNNKYKTQILRPDSQDNFEILGKKLFTIQT